MHTLRAFLLTRQWRDTSDGLELSLWAASEQGPLRVVVDREEAVCFVERAAMPESGALPNVPCRRRTLDLATLEGAPVDALYFRCQRDLVAARDLLRARGVSPCESDLKPADRYLMERFVTAGFAARGEVVRRSGYLEMRNPAIRRDDYRTTLRWASLDIETAGLDGALYSIALHSPDDERVLMVSEGPVRCDDAPVESFPSEGALLSRLFAWFAEHDPDLVLGWNVVGFDLDFIAARCRRLRLEFDIARGSERSAILRPGSTSGTHVARIPGRVVLDGIDTLRTAFWSFESFALEHVARQMLGRGKRIEHTGDRVGEIIRLYEQDRARLAAYNIEDCRLVAAIVEKAGLVEFSMRRAELTGLGMDRQGGSVAAFDNLYLPRLHRAGRVAPDVADARSGEGSPGGYILDSRPGLYDNVLVLDFKSLYPSIIRTFGIDPYALHAPGEDRIEGFQGGTFTREGAILPGLVQSIWEERDRAKQRGDAAMSQATKILMNSFYGILGASGCRFHDSRLASSITRRGHEIIRRTRDVIEEGGETVIYGDTDSLFVLLGAGVDEGAARERGSAIAAMLNEWWRRAVAGEHRLESFLEIEFETHFLKFLMPTVRGEATGSALRRHGPLPRRRRFRVQRERAHGLDAARPLVPARAVPAGLSRGAVRVIRVRNAGGDARGRARRGAGVPEAASAECRGIHPQRPAPRAGGAQARPEGALGALRHHDVGTRAGRGRPGAAPPRLRPLPGAPARPPPLPRDELRRDYRPADGDFDCEYAGTLVGKVRTAGRRPSMNPARAAASTRSQSTVCSSVQPSIS